MSNGLTVIRVLHVMHAMDYAGTETLLMNLYRNIDRSKLQFDFAVCTESICDYNDEIEEMGGKIFYYPRYRGVNHIEYLKWWDEFFENDLDHSIVHGHIGSTASIYLTSAKKHGRYTIAHSHNTYMRRISIKDILYRTYSYSTRFVADYFMGCSYAALKDRFGSKVANDTTKSSVFYNAIDTSKFLFKNDTRKAVRNELGISDDIFVLGTVGRLTRQKNPFMTLEIIDKLNKKGVSFKFVWFGRGELEGAIKNRISELGLENTVIMCGVRSDINRMLQAMDAFVFPSLWEGLGISCVEAQAADLKCFCSEAIPSEARIIESFETLSIKNADVWVARIADYIENNNHDRTIRDEEIKRAGYDVVRQAEWLTEFYLNVL